jgi:hypothetical protein
VPPLRRRISNPRWSVRDFDQKRVSLTEQVTWIIRENVLLRIGRRYPDDVDEFTGAEGIGIAGIEALMDLARIASVVSVIV